MLGNRTFLGIITARGGSKGMPRKNVQELNGKPLIAYTIEAAKESKYLDRCITSTEDEEIAALTKELGGDVPFLRPEVLATDSAKSLQVVQHVLNELGEHYDYIVILQPTSPLRTAEDIDACIQMAVDRDADSVFSMKEIPDFAPQKLKTLESDGRIKPLLQEETGSSAPRQDGPHVYKRNCAIYLTKTDLITNGDMFGEKSYGYVMPEERSFDINSKGDFALAAFWMQQS